MKIFSKTRFQIIKYGALLMIHSILLVVLLIIVQFVYKCRDTLIWGPGGLINNKYWSEAVKQLGYKSMTFMDYYSSVINEKDDFDLYYEDVIPHWAISRRIKQVLIPYYAMYYIIKNASVVHMPFTGGPLGQSVFWRLEAHIFRYFGIKTVLIPFGGDIHRVSKIMDPSARNALLINYPLLGKQEQRIEKRVKYWTKNADIMIVGSAIDGIGRWDVVLVNVIVINTELWNQRFHYSRMDGKNDSVKILHAPNHRGTKGTEYLIQAVDELISEGLKIELILLEGVKNKEIKETMSQVDILADQLILTAYGLNAIEGMATGLPVICNLDNDTYTRILRRYAYLDECPILSTTPETIKKNLRVLVTNPDLREQLGQAGRKYVEKYHSYKTAQYLLGSIYDKILNGQDVDLINLFHPILSRYNNSIPLVQHPLKENKLP
jgi:glycosyltransferase involved in cell wall biosynthesis